MTVSACPTQVEGTIHKAKPQGLPTAAHTLAIQLQALSSRISAVNEIAAAINRSLNLDDILGVVKSQAKWLLDFNHCSICLYDGDGVEQTILLFGDETSACSRPSINALLALTTTTKRPQLLQGGAASRPATSWPDTIWPATIYQSWLTMPIESEDHVWGAIAFASLYAHHYSQEDLRIVHLLALQLANAIRNANRFAEINHLYGKLAHTYQELQRSEELRADMMHMIVHDLRNPLSVINISLELLHDLLRQSTVVDRYQNIERAQRASRHMSGLIDDLLDFSKLENNEYQLTLALITIPPLLEELAAAWQLHATKERKQLRLEIMPDLAPIAVDVRLVRRVLDNLLGNAFKFTAANDTITLGANAHPTGLELYVADSGTGIPAAYHQRIFDKFFQVKAVDGESFNAGSGLGLAFCKLIVEAHGGTIWVESPGQGGSTFRFTLPLA